MKKIEESMVRQSIPIREKKSYKGTYGRLLFVGGNEQMGGAIILSAAAGLHSGAGLVTVASAPVNVHALHARIPEAMFLDMYDLDALQEMVKGMDGIVIGPGLGQDDRSNKVLETVLSATSTEQFIVVDGDAISVFINESMNRPAADIIFTPHLGEWKTLSDLSPDEEYLDLNQEKRAALDATVVLKKDQSEIYFQDEVWQNIPGNPSMATGGMGDTLAGMVGGFSAQFASRKEGILSAVYLHSLIANRLSETHYVTLPTMIINEIPKVMKEFAEPN
ncbi:NAD(P)H-hydrate dehydratase [Marinilactibacillus kalidii]|uniref:NAD(P)H-hydrate dehydratase n=1 Tax=Marinilactibacillus kalidii TaxID=2820274 RepID=UPI001ABE0E07|nr:NAD(P)H-hydrate dehydratase [Marinilactibacillus kalidii]